MDKIQVIHFVETLGKGGLENVIYNIATKLNSDLFDVRIVCRIEGGYTGKEIMNHGIPVMILGKNKIIPWNLKKTLSSFKTAKKAIINFHGLFSSSSEAIMGLRSGYDAVFVHVHNLERPETFYQRVKLNILKRSVNKFIAVSEGVRQCLLENSVLNVQTIYNGIDINRYKFNLVPKRELLGFPEDTFLVAMIGRIVKRKGFDQLLEIIYHIPNTSAIIVGSGPYEEDLKLLVSAKNLRGRVKFLPFQSQQHLPEIYSNIDTLFLFSEKEGLPLALLEAQSAGAPYIGNKVGGIGEVIKDDYNGFIIDKVDFIQIESMIQKIMKNPEHYRRNARKIIEEKFSLDTMLKKIEKLYLNSLLK